jgi:hypothetical protein
MPSAPTIIVRALQTAHFGFGRLFSRRLANREELTISNPTADMLESIKAQVTAGRLEILTVPTDLSLSPVRQKLKNQLHLQLGVNNSGIVVPNGAQVHKVTIGGVVFNLGDGGIDGANVTAQLAALNTAIAASAPLTALGASILTYKTLVGTTASVGTLTSDNTNVSAGETVTIGFKVYTFRTSLVAEGDVLIGGSADASLLNLINAINHTGTPGTDYMCAGANVQVSAAVSVTAHAFAVTALVAGLAGNSIVSTETSAHLAWGAATLASGAGANAVGVLIIDGSDIADWTAFQAATSVTDSSGATITYPGVAATFFTRTTADSFDTKVPVLMSYTVLQADVDRGYLVMDTGLSDLTAANTRPTWAVRISRGTSPSVTTVAHDGTVTIEGGRSILFENDGSVDFAAADVIQVFAFGAD